MKLRNKVAFKIAYWYQDFGQIYGKTKENSLMEFVSIKLMDLCMFLINLLEDDTDPGIDDEI